MADGISAIQIQTIDACNSHCIMCPHKSIPHNGKAIDDDLFAAIVNQLAVQVCTGTISRTAEVHLYFQNEPLLDTKLFERASYVRTMLPQVYLICCTNGLLLPKLKQQIMESEFDKLVFSLYGVDVPSFNRITGLMISQKQYDEMLSAMAEITRSKKLDAVTSSSWRHDESGRMVLFDYSSRAGFYTGKILHRHGVRGCQRNRERWLNFHADGEMVLCCMDWQKETVFGDIKKRSLGEILASESYGRLVGRVRGDLDSKESFICKRCEWAISDTMATPAATDRPVAASQGRERRSTSLMAYCGGIEADLEPVVLKPPDLEQNTPAESDAKATELPLPVGDNDEKTLVFTSVGLGYDQLCLDWLVSLRTLGRYEGEVLILDYGIRDETRVVAQTLGAQLYRCECAGPKLAIVNRRFVDVLPVLEQRYPQYKIAHFDADIWFTEDVNRLFQELDEIPGCLYSVETRGHLENAGHGPQDKETLDANITKVRKVIVSCKGHINGGFMAGRYESMIGKLAQMRAAYEHGWQVSEFGVDQYLTNVLFDFARDSARGYRWNCAIHEATQKDDGFYHRKLTGMLLQDGHWKCIERIREEKVVGLHLCGRGEKTETFRKYNRGLFRQTIADAWSGALQAYGIAEGE